MGVVGAPAIMMGTAWVLTGNARIAVVASLVPFVLGMTNTLTGVGYGITAAVFLLAVAVQVGGEDTIADARGYAEQLIQNAKTVRLTKEPQREPKVVTKAEAKTEAATK